MTEQFRTLEAREEDREVLCAVHHEEGSTVVTVDYKCKTLEQALELAQMLENLFSQSAITL